MNMLIGGVGMALILVILWDGFETMVLPRRVRRRMRLTWLFHTYTWRVWSSIARRIRKIDRREEFLSNYGPLSLLLLLAIWALGLVLGFGMLQWSIGSLADPA